MKTISTLLTIILCLSAQLVKAQNDSILLSPEQEKAYQYIEKNGQNPTDYILEKFKLKDLVFIGEYHRLKQCLTFLSDLIPELYNNGIYNIGFEFGPYEYQKQIDSMLVSEHYDEELISESVFNWYPVWIFNEYYNVYRKTWEFNQSLPDGARPFRIVNLNYCPDYKYRGVSRKSRMKFFYKGSTDVFSAEVIFDEFVDKNEKALIYSGIHHSFTKYHQPIVVRGVHYGFQKERMGNIVYDSIPERVSHILIHHPWRDKNRKMMYPLNGQFEMIMSKRDHQPVGIDTEDNPLSELIIDTACIYAQGYDNFNLGTICDGYIYLVPLDKYEDMDVDNEWLDQNWRRIRKHMGFMVKLAGMTKKSFIKLFIKEAGTINKFPAKLE